MTQADRNKNMEEEKERTKMNKILVNIINREGYRR